jgi:hypothetical protein
MPVSVRAYAQGMIAAQISATAPSRSQRLEAR